jgi:hypothetical protein
MRLDRLHRLRASLLSPVAAAALALTPACGDETKKTETDTASDAGDTSSNADTSEGDASADASEDASGDASEEVDSMPFSMTIESGNYAAAATSDPDTYVAVVVGENNSVLAYACDSKTRGQWFSGNPLSLPAVLTATDYSGTEVSLFLDLQDGKIVGTISTGAEDETPLTFSLPKVEGQPVLYRGSYAVTEQEVLGGWIVLPDGTQRGLTVSKTSDGTSASSQSLDTTSNSISIAECDDTADAIPAEFTISICSPTSGCIPVVSTDTRPQFNVVTFGDSFAAGEGAPDSFGSGCLQNRDSGEPAPPEELGCQQAPLWGPDPESSYCHRSSYSGSALAVEKLQAEFPMLNIQFKSFACTGAKLAELHSKGQVPGTRIENDKVIPDNKAWPMLGTGLSRAPVPVPPQLDQLKSFMESRSCLVDPDQVPSCWSSVDVLVMNIGGNDASFADVVKEAVSKGSLDDDCSESAPKITSLIRDALDPTKGNLGGRFDSLAASLLLARFLDCRSVVPTSNNTFLLELPSIATSSNGQACTDQEFKSVESDRAECTEEYIVDMRGCESSLLEGPLADDLRSAFDTAAAKNNWTYVEGIKALSIGNGLCASPGTRWFNTNCDALIQQGQDMLADTRAGFGDDLSMGIAHPNREGYAGMYRDPIADALREKIRIKFAPVSAAQLRLVGLTKTSATSNGVTTTTLQATLSWQDKSSTEKEFKLTPTGTLNSEQVFPTEDKAGTRTVTKTSTLKHTGSSGSVDVKVSACSDINICTEGPTLTVTGNTPPSVVKPNPISVSKNSKGVVASWNKVDGPAVQIYKLTFKDSRGATVLTQQVPALTSTGSPNTSVFIAFPTASPITVPGKIAVQACNFTGCAAASADFAF